MKPGPASSPEGLGLEVGIIISSSDQRNQHTIARFRANRRKCGRSSRRKQDRKASIFRLPTCGQFRSAVVSDDRGARIGRIQRLGPPTDVERRYPWSRLVMANPSDLSFSGGRVDNAVRIREGLRTRLASNGRFGQAIRENIVSGKAPFRTAYLRSVIDRIAVDDRVVRIIGDTTTLEQVVAGKSVPAAEVRSLAGNWRTRHDSNV